MDARYRRRDRRAPGRARRAAVLGAVHALGPPVRRGPPRRDDALPAGLPERGRHARAGRATSGGGGVTRTTGGGPPAPDTAADGRRPHTGEGGGLARPPGRAAPRPWARPGPTPPTARARIKRKRTRLNPSPPS